MVGRIATIADRWLDIRVGDEPVLVRFWYLFANIKMHYTQMNCKANGRFLYMIISKSSMNNIDKQSIRLWNLDRYVDWDISPIPEVNHVWIGIHFEYWIGSNWSQLWFIPTWCNGWPGVWRAESRQGLAMTAIVARLSKRFRPSIIWMSLAFLTLGQVSIQM